MRLSEFPYVHVRISCTRCGRQGQYRLARLADKYGSEVSLGSLLEMLVGECSQRGPKVRAYDYCGAHFRDLKSPRPPDEPVSAPRLRVVR